MAEGISLEELQLAARNHGMPLEALRYPVTPVGLHYLLTHYDVPDVDAGSWSLRVRGEQEVSLGLDQVRARPWVELAVTMECAGNGRARLTPRPVSQPWLLEAVGTAEWSGVPLRTLLDDAGLGGDAVEIVFTGHDRGVEGGVEQDYARSLRIEDAMVRIPRHNKWATRVVTHIQGVWTPYKYPALGNRKWQISEGGLSAMT